MLTVKSILTGALVLGAATVPAGVVVTEFASDWIPAAPGAIAAQAPMPESVRAPLDEALTSVVLVPPAPTRAIEVREPDLAVAPFLEIPRAPALPLPPRPEPVSGVEGPVLQAEAFAPAEAVLRPVPIDASG